MSLSGFLFIVFASTGDFDAPFAIEKTFATEGCIAPYSSIQVANNKIIYYSDKGLALFDGSRSEVISYKIQPTFDALTNANIVAGNSGVFRDLNQYWFAVADGDSGDRIIVYDYHHDAFLLHDGIESNALLSIEDSSEDERFYTGDYNGYVYRQNQGLNDYVQNSETAVNAYYVTKNYDFESFLYSKETIHCVVIYGIR